MCSVILLRGYHREHPILVAANRDEDRGRAFSPPGLTVGERQRMLSPKDRRAGGTWLGVNGAGMVAALTNVAGEDPVAGARTRGDLPHLALDCADAASAVRAVDDAVRQGTFASFRLVVADPDAAWSCEWVRGQLSVAPRDERCIAWSNEHPLGGLEVAGLERLLGPVHSAAHRLDLLRPLLLRDGSEGGHQILKSGGDYGTVSSSLIAVPRPDVDDPSWAARLIWRFAKGPPDEALYRDYGNLGRRLLPEPG